MSTAKTRKKPEPAFIVFAMSILGVGLPLFLYAASEYLKTADGFMPWFTLILSWIFLAMLSLRKGLSLSNRLLSPLYAYAGLTMLPALLFVYYILMGGASVSSATNWFKDCLFWATGVTEFQFAQTNVRLPVIILPPTYALLICASLYIRFFKPERGVQVLGCGQHERLSEPEELPAEDSDDPPTEVSEEPPHVVHVPERDLQMEPAD